MNSSAKPLTKHPRLLHLLDQDIVVRLKGPKLSLPRRPLTSLVILELPADVVNIITGYATVDTLLHVRARAAKRVLEGIEGPGLPAVLFAVIAEYMDEDDEDDDVIARGKEQERMLQEQSGQ